MDQEDLPALRGLMHFHRRRTGVGLDDVLRAGGTVPAERFEAVRQFYRSGGDHVDESDIRAVLACWDSLPARAVRKANAAASRKQTVALTPEIRGELRRHFLRVGLSIEAFFEGLAGVPGSLSSRMLYRWLSDDPPMRVRRDHLEFVLAAWVVLPDRLGTPRRTHFIPFRTQAGDCPDQPA